MADMERSIQTEQALLGAVLSDPAGQQEVLDWMRPDDMRRPYHGQVLAAMQRLRARGVLPGPVAVRDELAKDPDLPVTAARDGVRLAELMERSPRAGHAQAYAALVIDSAVHERLRLAGSRIEQAAESGNLEAAFRQAREARREATAAKARWERLPEHLRRDVPVPGRDASIGAEIARRAKAVRDELARLRDDMWSAGSHDIQERLAGIAQQIADTAALSADRAARTEAAAEAVPQGKDAHAAASQALRDLTAGPQHISEVSGWLKPRPLPHPRARRAVPRHRRTARRRKARRPRDRRLGSRPARHRDDTAADQRCARERDGSAGAAKRPDGASARCPRPGSSSRARHPGPGDRPRIVSPASAAHNRRAAAPGRTRTANPPGRPPGPACRAQPGPATRPCASAGPGTQPDMAAPRPRAPGGPSPGSGGPLSDDRLRTRHADPGSDDPGQQPPAHAAHPADLGLHPRSGRRAAWCVPQQPRAGPAAARAAHVRLEGHGMSGKRGQGTVYLLHFDRPYRHAKHYTGWARDLDARLAAHERGQGARLLEVVHQAGISWRLARTWPGSRARERQIKTQGGASRCCPLCGVTPRTGSHQDQRPDSASQRAAVGETSPSVLAYLQTRRTPADATRSQVFQSGPQTQAEAGQ